MRQFTELKKRYPNDPALTYAIDVVTGQVLAGEKMKQACERHINDLKRIEDDDDFIYIYMTLTRHKRLLSLPHY